MIGIRRRFQNSISHSVRNRDSAIAEQHFAVRIRPVELSMSLLFTTRLTAGSQILSVAARLEKTFGTPCAVTGGLLT
jgi:hypothetical protein